MTIRFKRYLVLALLLLVPAQGMASMLHALGCAGHSEQQEMDVHAHASHDHGSPHQHPDDMSGSAPDHSNHTCCHHLSSAALINAGGASVPDLPVYQSSLSLLATLFIPEQPHRPPRA